MKKINHADNNDLDLEVNSFKRRTRHIRILSLVCTLTSIAICGGCGYLIDRWLDKNNFYTIIGFILAFVFMNVSVIYLSKKYINQERAQLG